MVRCRSRCQQRPFAQRTHQDLLGVGLPGHADRFPEKGIGLVRLTGQDVRDSPVAGGRRRHDARDRVLALGLVQVGAHLLDPVTAVHGPQRGGKRLGGRVTGPARVLVLPVVDQAGPSLGLGRPPGHRVEEPGHHRDHRVRSDSVSLFQPADPPLQGVAAPGPVGGQPQLLDQAGGGADVLGRDGILQRVLGQAATLIPGGGAALQHRGQSWFAAFQLGPQHVAEQVMVAVPLPR